MTVDLANVPATTAATNSTPPVTIDGTSTSTDVPLTIKNGVSGSGLVLQATGTATTAFLIKDATPTTRLTAGVCIAANDFITGTVAGDAVITVSSGKTLWIGGPTSSINLKVNSSGFTVAGATGGNITMSTSSGNGISQIISQNDGGKFIDMYIEGSAAAGTGALAANCGGLFCTGTGETDIVSTAATLWFYLGGTATSNRAMSIDTNKNVAVGTAAIATNATNGFLYIPTCAGPPTGTPTAKTGLVPIVYNTTDHKLYVFDVSWLGGTAPGVWS